MKSTTHVTTAKANNYIKQLCNHFRHKVEVEQTKAGANFNFSVGRGLAEAEEGILSLVAEASNTEDLAQVESIMGSHLERFAFRENLTVVWSRNSDLSN